MDLSSSLLLRFPTTESAYTSLDVYQDTLGFVRYLQAGEYLTDLLVRTHGLPPRLARERCKEIRPHIEIAMSYLEQAHDGPEAVAFLPAYYAILNLLKVVILIGPHGDDLRSNRWHGATYDVYGKDSHGLPTEVVTLKTGGALPLYYKTITGSALAKQRKVQMSDLLPFISDIGAEYALASGRPSDGVLPISSSLKLVSQGSHTMRITLHCPDGFDCTRVTALEAFPSFKKRVLATPQPIVAGMPNDIAFERVIPLAPVGTNVYEAAAAGRRAYLLRHPFIGDGLQVGRLVPIPSKGQLPEEMVIALAFFHMSNVVRYKPDFLGRLRESRYWPVLHALKRHGLLNFLTLFWSIVHKKTLILTKG